MANTLTFTPGGTGASALTITPVPGSVQYGGDHDDRGGGEIPQARAAKAANGSCQVVIDSVTVTLAALKTLVEKTCIDSTGAAAAAGPGAMEVTGAGDYAAVVSHIAIVDINIEGDSVQVATITWKGSVVAPA
jgi:hypothetical protein